MDKILHTVDFCVVGGGLAGMCAAIAAARHGAKVALMHERPVLGGNCSSEIRMWVCGAHGKNNRETGIVEEIGLENAYRNPYKNYSIWDSILYEKVASEKNITLLLNCSCNSCEMENDKIKSVTGWQMTTQSWHTINAKIFADCSGDSILAPLTGAQFSMGREGRDEYNEDIAPEVADKKTMGNTCLLQARQTYSKKVFIAPEWARKLTKEDFNSGRMPNLKNRLENFWYLELGGTRDTIKDAESIRDELLALTFGTWDYIKNSGDFDADNWELDWVGFLPGKRESRRYKGAYVMTQNDVRSEGNFEDLIAYGGWSMDDHHPEGFNYNGKPTIFHKAPSPFGIPYRSLYSCNIENLMFAGRNISMTHTAMSSSRVMATCAILGQAVGTAASIACSKNEMPREVEVKTLKQQLMYDDCYLPFNKREITELTKKAKIKTSTGDGEVLRNGYDRPIGDDENGWICGASDWVEYSFSEEEYVNKVRLVFDSNLTGKGFFMASNRYLDEKPVEVPSCMIKSFKLAIDGEEKVFDNNYQRLVEIPVNKNASNIKFIPLETWGDESALVFAFDII